MAQGRDGNNPITSGNRTTADVNGAVSASGDLSMELALATKMQLILDQPMTDVATGLVNRDFEGDFFKIGDTVAIVKPNVDSIQIEVQNISTGKDARLVPNNVSFSKQIMTIDKAIKYAFTISDLTEVEGRWNYESGNLDLVAQEIRKRHNRETLELILNNTTTNAQDETQVYSVTGTPSSPSDLSTAASPADAIYEDVIIPMFTRLYEKGAITADGQVTYGSNSQQGKSTKACLYVPTKVYATLLTSKYLQDRATVAADEKVESGKVKTIMGFDIMIEPSLDAGAKHSVKGDGQGEAGVAGLASNALCIVAGTRNLVTRAGKVLPPDKFRSHQFFADEYHGMEIYAEKVVEPLAGAVAFVTL